MGERAGIAVPGAASVRCRHPLGAALRCAGLVSQGADPTEPRDALCKDATVSDAQPHSLSPAPLPRATGRSPGIRKQLPEKEIFWTCPQQEMLKEGNDASTRMDGEVLECCSWTPPAPARSSLSLSPCKHLKHPPAMEQNPTSLLAVSRQGKQKSRRGAGSQDGTWGSLSFSSPSEHFGVSSLFLLSHLLSSNDSCFDPRIEHNFCLTLEGTVWAFEIHCTSTSWCKMPFTL